MTVRGYPEYRESGVEWVASIPSAWSMVRAKDVFKIVNGSTPKSDEPLYWDGDIVWITPADLSNLPNSNIMNSSRTISQAGLDSCASSLVPPGSIILSTRAPIGSIGIAAVNLCTNQGCRALIPRHGTQTAYFFYVVSMSSEQLNIRGRGTTFLELSGESLAAFPLPLPPTDEQLAIAAFLDRETGKIDALVAEQERLIALLKEKRQAVISHAVTKGLNPNAPMKDSGVPWLGEVPAHWEVKRIKYVARLESGHTPSKQFPEYWEGGEIEWVSLNDSKHLAVNDYISETAVRITVSGLANSSARLLPSGSVVFTRDATIGLAAITTKPKAVSQHLIAWCPSEQIDQVYLLRVFDVLKPFLDASTFGATIKTIGMPDVKKLVTPVPSIDEQAQIVSWMGEYTASLDTLAEESAHAIALLRERRAALISAAVTGKIDVRDTVAQPSSQAA